MPTNTEEMDASHIPQNTAWISSSAPVRYRLAIRMLDGGGHTSDPILQGLFVERAQTPTGTLTRESWEDLPLTILDVHGREIKT